ncbi:MAG: hypothetical protein H6707_18040 [Deltaproteobacteria bacterium]|nr:hypothetical protein [Deltaproteobacteria bacterium]
MVSPNKNADLGALLERLLAADVTFVLVGGLAAVAQGAPTTTFDVDIVPALDKENIERLDQVLRELNAYYRRPDSRIIPVDAHALARGGHHLLVTELGALDILATIEKQQGYEDLAQGCESIEFRGYQLSVLTLQQMLSLKADSSHEKDQQLVALLRAMLAGGADDE